MSCDNQYYDGKFGELKNWINSAALNLDSNIYAAADILTDGYITFSCSARDNGETGTIRGIKIVTDNNGTGGVALGGTLYVFNAAPASQTKNGAYTMTATEAASLQAVITVTAGFTAGDDLGITIIHGLEHNYVCASGDSALYGIFIVAGTPDFAASATTVISLYVRKD